MHYVILFLLFFSPLLGKPTVTVSTTPYAGVLATLVEDIATVHVCVPSSVSGHTWEPKPNDILKIHEAILWLRTGEPFEQKVVTILEEQNKHIQVVDLREGIDLLYGHSCCHSTTRADPHFWLSPPQFLRVIETMEKALEEAFPQERAVIHERADLLKKQIEELHQELLTSLKPYQGTVLVVAHEAYSYFCKEYGLIQLPIEREGKELTLKEFISLIEQAKEAHVQTVFTQKQYPKKASEQISEALHATVKELNPYSDNYLKMMHDLAKAFEEEGSQQKQ